MYSLPVRFYNDDYSVAVLDFLVNKIEQEQKQ
ncbi:thiol-disulfide interchange protein [Haemophilus influenzae]|uniref:Thiol-disulfide interchange protein n=1 Tax=Haemophilus influenzae TaxID=727 RepID=A0A2X1PQ83_HAEIF|nr:thiol-disulfide interchange protein [Haemophilus influenzae]